jgi:putative endonuclease
MTPFGLMLCDRIWSDAIVTWMLYLLECRGGTYYAGITNDLVARYRAHVEGKGARYTRAHPPKRVLGVASFMDRSSASKAEWAIKQLPRDRKLRYLTTLSGAWPADSTGFVKTSHKDSPFGLFGKYG